MSATMKRFRALVITVIVIAATNYAVSFASGVATLPDGPKPKSGVATLPDGPKPRSGVATLPDGPKPRSGVPMLPDCPKP